MSDREQIEELYLTYWRCMINKDIAGMDRLTNRIAEYIKNQLKEDQPGEQIAISEAGPFKGIK